MRSVGVCARVCLQYWVFVGAFLRARACRCAYLPLHTHVRKARACLTWMIVWPLWERGRHWAGSCERGRLCGNPDKCEMEAEKTLLDLGLGVQVGFNQGPGEGSSLFPDSEGWPWGSSAALGPGSGLLRTVTRIRAAAPRRMQGRGHGRLPSLAASLALPSSAAPRDPRGLGGLQTLLLSWASKGGRAEGWARSRSGL